MLAALITAGVASAPGSAQDAQEERAEAARRALRNAATFYRTRVASHGGYVYYYSEDLRQRWGEGEATADQIWVQPPGTPTVGLAYLRAYSATANRYYLDTAKEAADALMHGQLRSGGWTNSVDFDPQGARVAQYRNGKGRGRNTSSLDDGITQSALQLLMRVDEALEPKDARIHQAAQVALDALLQAQYANGAFPQGWTGAVPRQPVVPASYPTYDWRTEGRVKNYWDMYTLNDGLAGTVFETLKTAAEVYKDGRYKAAAARLGDFLILAQMPEPQPAWAQQYGYSMHPIWARRFEPPAITGWESQDAIETLMKVHELTGDRKYLEPIPRALAYLRRSRLPDGRMARYYELKTNRPLYMTRTGGEYTPTYDDANLPDHYGWKQPSRLDRLEADYNTLNGGGRRRSPSKSVPELEREVRKIISGLDAEGRWVSTYSGQRLTGQPKLKMGERFIGSDVFSRNVELLADYIIAARRR